MYKPLARLTRKKGEKTQTTNIRNERDNVTTDLADTKRLTGCIMNHLCQYIQQLRLKWTNSLKTTNYQS